MNFHALQFARSGGRCLKRAKPEVLTYPEGRKECICIEKQWLVVTMA